MFALGFYNFVLFSVGVDVAVMPVVVAITLVKMAKESLSSELNSALHLMK